MFIDKVNRLLNVTKRDPEIWPTMVMTFAVIMYGADVGYRKLKGDPMVPGPFEKGQVEEAMKKI